MNILAFESTCDETAVAVVRDGREVLSDAIASQVDMHTIYGGVVPEIASRKHVEAIAGLADQALQDAGLSKKDIDAVAVSYAPGLIGAVLVGVNFAKSVALALGVPLIPVHHIRGHIAANYIAHPDLEPPFVCLCVSGGNTLSAAMDRLAQGGDDGKYALPRSHVEGYPLDMSFSGLKTAVLNLLHNAQQKGEELDGPGLAASFQAAVSDILVPRVMEAARRKGYGKIAVAGGVGANSRIRADLEKACKASGDKLFLPPLSLCGDNGAMVGSQGYYEYLAGHLAGSDLNAYATRDVGRG